MGFTRSEKMGLDNAEKMLSGAIKKFAKKKDIDFYLADAADLPFSSEFYDTINIANAFHCLPEVDKSLKEIYRTLKTHGTFAGNVLLFPKRNSFFDKIANKINNWAIKKGILYSPYRIEDIILHLEKNNFEIIYSEVKGNCFNFIAKKKI